MKRCYIDIQFKCIICNAWFHKSSIPFQLSCSHNVCYPCLIRNSFSIECPIHQYSFYYRTTTRIDISELQFYVNYDLLLIINQFQFPLIANSGYSQKRNNINFEESIRLMKEQFRKYINLSSLCPNSPIQHTYLPTIKHKLASSKTESIETQLSESQSQKQIPLKPEHKEVQQFSIGCKDELGKYLNRSNNIKIEDKRSMSSMVQKTSNLFSSLSLSSQQQTPLLKYSKNNKTWDFQQLFLKNRRIKNYFKNLSNPTQGKPLKITKRFKYDCEQELSKYSKKQKIENLKNALTHFTVYQGTIEIINYSLLNVELKYLLDFLDLDNPTTTKLKLVKVGLVDEQFNMVLNFVQNIETLVVAGNNLSEKSLQMVQQFSKSRSKLERIYMGHNRISSKWKCTQQLNRIKQNGIIISL